MKASFVYFVTKNLAYICNNRFFGLISAVSPVPDGNIRLIVREKKNPPTEISP